MAYATYPDISNEISNLGELVPDGKVAKTWVESKISTAELEINGKLQSRYATPLTSASAIEILKPVSIFRTCYSILAQNYTQENGNASDWVQDYKKRADEILNMILDGTIDLDATSSTISTDSIQSSTIDVARTFSNGTYDSSGNSLSVGTLDGF